MFKEGDLIRQITDEGNGEIVRVLEDVPNGGTVCHVAVGNDDADTWIDVEDYELVTDNQKTIQPDPPPMLQEQHTVAIVSFEGAIQREARSICEALKLTDESSYKVTVTMRGRVDENTCKISYTMSDDGYGDDVKGSIMQETLAEYLRRKGWKKNNDPIAIPFNGVPS